MQAISLAQNLPLLTGSNLLIVGSARERSDALHYLIGHLIGARVFLCRDRLQAEVLDEFLQEWRLMEPEKDLVIFDGNFTKSAVGMIEVPQVLQRARRQPGVTLVAGTDKFNFAPSFYRHFDFVLAFRPSRFQERLETMFGMVGLAPLGREHYVLVDNRGEPVGYIGPCQELQEEIGDLVVDEEDSCCICLEEYCEEEILTRCISCDNKIHYRCAMEWGEISATCPLCRGSLDGCRRYRAIFTLIDELEF